MLAHSGARFGLRRTLPHLCGIVMGTTSLTLVGLVVLEPIVTRWPASLVVIKVPGSCWLLWIGLKMARAARSPTVAENERPMGFVAAALFQFSNPKAITSTIALASLALTAANRNPWLLGVALLAVPPAGFVANGTWAVAGLSIRRFLATPGRWAIFTGAMGVLCGGSALFLWL